MKKATSEFIFEISACQEKRTPYNAPPLTRNNGFLVGHVRKGKENKLLTLQRESVIYAARATENVAPLFNNLSDNLCGHSRTGYRKKYCSIKSQSEHVIHYEV